MTKYIAPTKAESRMMATAHREATELLYQQHLRGIFDDGDPNHPKWNNGINYATGKPVKLFGEDTDKFITRQYR